MGGFYAGMPGRTDFFPEEGPPNPIDQELQRRAEMISLGLSFPPGSSARTAVMGAVPTTPVLPTTPAPGQPIGGVPAAVRRPIPPAGPSGEVIVPQGPEQPQMFGRPASEEAAFYRESVGAGPVGAQTTPTGGLGGPMSTGGPSPVPPGDFAKFVESRRGKPAEIPGAGVIGRQLPTDPRAMYELNQFMGGFEADKLRGDVERAQGLQSLEEAQINPRDMAAAKVGLMKGQTEESLGQAEAARGTGALMRARASTEAPSAEQGKMRGTATANEIMAMQGELERMGDAFTQTPEGQVQVKIAIQEYAKQLPAGTPMDVIARWAAMRVRDSYVDSAVKQWLSKTMAARDPLSLQFAQGGGPF